MTTLSTAPLKQAIKIVAIATLLVPTLSWAKNIQLGLTGSGEAAYSASTGNTVASALYTALKLNYSQETYKLKILIEANNKSENNIQIKERYAGGLQGDVYFPNQPKAYGFAQSRWENDRLADIDLNSYYIAGLGYHFIKSKKIKLHAEIGVGYQAENYTPNTPTPNFSQAMSKLRGDFSYKFNDSVEFSQDATEYYGSIQAKFESNTSIQASVSDAFKLKMSYKYRYNTNPAVDKVKEDSETYFGIIYDF